MTRQEALDANTLLLALLGQKGTLRRIGLSLGMTEFDGLLLDGMKRIADSAHARLGGVGLDGAQVELVYRQPDRLYDVMTERIKTECGSKTGQTLTRN